MNAWNDTDQLFQRHRQSLDGRNAYYFILVNSFSLLYDGISVRSTGEYIIKISTTPFCDGSMGLRTWPMTHVTHSKTVTHFTNDPLRWLSALLRSREWYQSLARPWFSIGFRMVAVCRISSYWCSRREPLKWWSGWFTESTVAPVDSIINGLINEWMLNCNQQGLLARRPH